MSSSTETAACPFGHGAEAPAGHHGYEPFQMKDPFPAYAELRAEQPVMFDERIGYYVVSRYDDIKAVFDDWETFSSENAQAPVRKRGPQATKIMEEGGFTAYSGCPPAVPPEHTRIRAVAQKAFTPRRYKALEPFIRQNVVDQLEAMLASPEHRGELVKDLAYDRPDGHHPDPDRRRRLPGGHVQALVRFPRGHDLGRPERRRTDPARPQPGRVLAGVPAPGPRGPRGRRRQPDRRPGRGAAGRRGDHRPRDRLDPATRLLFAGHETTTTLIANSLRVLLAHPDQWQQLVEDPKKIPAAIDEVLRYAGSIVGWRRKAAQGHRSRRRQDPGGRRTAAADGLGQPGREPVSSDGEEFDISRGNAREHLSFGFGIHYCLGNMLAKLQAKIALEEVVRLAPNLTLESPERHRVPREPLLPRPRNRSR